MRLNSQQPHLYFHGQSNISSISFSPEKRSIQKKSKSDDSLTPLSLFITHRTNVSQIEIIENTENTYLDLKTQQMARGGGEKKKNYPLCVVNLYKIYRNYSMTSMTPKTTVSSNV